MKFYLRERRGGTPAGTRDVCYLTWNTWDDFGFKTTHEVTAYDEDGLEHDLGATQIMFRGQEAGYVQLDLPTEGLDDKHCSLGNDRNYYLRLMKMPPAPRQAILSGLRDLTFEPDRYQRFKGETALKVSLLRNSSENDVLVVYPRILRGETELTTFAFDYVLEAEDGADPAAPTLSLRFVVVPGKKPPTNLHVLIGRNGVGKTRILAGMADALTDNQAAAFGLAGRFEFDENIDHPSSDFLNLVIVSFSAFDRFDPIAGGSARTEKSLPYYYVGVKRFLDDEKGNPTDKIGVKSTEDLNDDLREALDTIFQDEKRTGRWVRALTTLSSDPGIRDLRASEVAGEDGATARNRVKQQIPHMSSGHKIVLLTITRLIENVSDRSLVLMDEPETHLHPPLLGSFMRALSELLVEINAVAIVASHSPVVLQEVPAKRVWRLLGSGGSLRAERPVEETFAENVSVLTRKVFGLEVEESGFYKLLSDEARHADFEEVDATFGFQIGAEGRALLRALTYKKD
ncbi:ATP-binding protein [Sphingomonas paeninsulae]|uniref:ATP-binding protein n=1 Tax=Sphingomonas paeninsulae TaxID=2319844 RepID=A0A494TAT6_SPHPE|nr:AAA family ATPase [Sphingomonas paeninsulae]AYJ86559.1 ATP-binding protein [Sphingomonas paeninsulae]